MHIVKKSLCLLLGTFSVLTLSFLLSCKEKKKEATIIPTKTVNKPVQAEGFVIRTRALSENIQVPGSLLPFESTEIRPEISGRIVQLDIPEGKIVQKGALLVKLFD
ncbi:MAG: biotin/lipoyl-binding protein, partial [Chitinophagaceae bacterium]|nr:biotin/lipoyl-binding protein [Chitinophagaceae bacterium]